MVLAGNMKLRHFLVLAITVGVATCGGVLLALHLYDAGKTVRESIDGDEPPAEGAAVTSDPLMAEPAPEAVPDQVPEPISDPLPDPAPDLVPNAAPDPDPAPAARIPAASPAEIAVMGWRGKDLATTKKKDTTKGFAFKVNVYQDAGNSVCNRAKVDLDRDDLWDVKYTFDGDSITRQVAPADDEDYTQRHFWTGESWAEE